MSLFVIRIVTFFSLLLFFLVSLGETITVVFLETFGSNFCPQVVNFHFIGLLIVLFSLLTVIHLTAIIGLCSNSSACKYIFYAVSSLLFIGLTVLLVLFCIHWTQNKSILEKCADFEFNLQKHPKSYVINSYQKNHHCCGLISKEDWGNVYPPSCCKDEKSPCDAPFDTPCSQFLIKWKPWILFNTLGGLCTMILLSPLVIAGLIRSRKRTDTYLTLNDRF
ncbi:hypothetical protein RF11_01310 [Thelohanellus kitauei]|uniref:Tetraspanin n=1 Tax=Thelohanellus kitauei TaxID=669202 RepID=A0A0C2MNR0_THEKT|nr:hypothetical protein RF11_01310 [Thelohanellus kitauei]